MKQQKQSKKAIHTNPKQANEQSLSKINTANKQKMG